MGEVYSNFGQRLGNELEQGRHGNGLWRYVVGAQDRYTSISNSKAEMRITTRSIR